MNKSQKAALFVFLSLLTTLITGLVLYFAYAGEPETAVPLLAGCVLVAFVMVLAAARVTGKVRRSRMLADVHQVPPSRALHALDLRQWLTLLGGITVIAIGAGALTGVRVLAAGEEPAAALPPAATPDPVPAFTTEPAPEPTFETPATTPPETETPPETVEASDVPVPEATKYLDEEEPIEGYYEAKAVAFSARRHIRGVQFRCDDASDSVLQWNVAGMTRFRTTAGIDDTTDNTFGKAVEFLFYDQDGRKLGRPVEVSVGHPKDVELSLANVVSLRMTCAARDAKTGEERSTYAAFGDPVVTSD